MSTTARDVRWQDGDIWLGYCDQHPDYLTRGETPSELEGNRRDLCRDLHGREAPGIGSAADLAAE